MKKKIVFKEKPAMGRIPTAPKGTVFFKDKSKYSRKKKHQESNHENV
jgi:hypothetical protein